MSGTPNQPQWHNYPLPPFHLKQSSALAAQLLADQLQLEEVSTTEELQAFLEYAQSKYLSPKTPVYVVLFGKKGLLTSYNLAIDDHWVNIYDQNNWRMVDPVYLRAIDAGNIILWSPELDRLAASPKLTKQQTSFLSAVNIMDRYHGMTIGKCFGDFDVLISIAGKEWETSQEAQWIWSILVVWIASALIRIDAPQDSLFLLNETDVTILNALKEGLSKVDPTVKTSIWLI